MESITCSVADLDSEDRSTFERVLGHPLRGDQQLRIEIVGKNRLSRPRPPVTGIPKAGQYEGRLIVPDDFDEPLDDLHEYME
jgi:hypothetical protein